MKNMSYFTMYNFCNAIADLIKVNLDIKSHELLCPVDVLVGDVEKQLFYVDFQARNKNGDYYRIKNYFSLTDMFKCKLISEHAYNFIVYRINCVVKEGE